MPRLSCILPVMDRGGRMEPTLISLLENRPADCEILLVLTVPYDDPYELGGEVVLFKLRREATHCPQSITPSRSLNRRSFHLLSVGMAVTPLWAERASRISPTRTCGRRAGDLRCRGPDTNPQRRMGIRSFGRTVAVGGRGIDRT